jgi:hypothetical protein
MCTGAFRSPYCVQRNTDITEHKWIITRIQLQHYRNINSKPILKKICDGIKIHYSGLTLYDRYCSNFVRNTMLRPQSSRRHPIKLVSDVGFIVKSINMHNNHTNTHWTTTCYHTTTAKHAFTTACHLWDRPSPPSLCRTRAKQLPCFVCCNPWCQPTTDPTFR